jgi:hypothetical protein
METDMSSFEKDLHARRAVMMFFAFITGASAVASAVLPSIVHA